MIRRFQILFLGLILLFAFVVRLYRFDNPVADWHSWRQTDTSAVSRTFAVSGFDLLHPKYEDLSNVPSGHENPNGYRFVEFPIYNVFQAGLFDIFHVLTIEQWGRIVSIFAILGSIVFIFLLVRKYFDISTALFSSFFFAFLPYSIYYGRTILPDELMVTAGLGGLYFFDAWVEKKTQDKVFSIKYWILFFLSVLFCSSALLLKPFAIFLLLPIGYLAIHNLGIKAFLNWKLWVFASLSILPLLMWRMWMQQYPEGIPVSGWLLNGGNIRFKGAFFYWIFAERISKLILGYFGIFLLLAGVLKQKKDSGYFFFLSILISSILYLFVVARGNVQHDYYQILIIPSISIFLGRGVSFLLSFEDRANKTIGKALILFCVLFMFALSWFYVRDFFNINNRSIIEAGKKADEILPKDAKVIAPYDGSTVFLYMTNRQGWPVFTTSIENLIKKGADFLVIADPTPNDFSGFGKKYQAVASSKTYLILKLR